MTMDMEFILLRPNEEYSWTNLEEFSILTNKGKDVILSLCTKQQKKKKKKDTTFGITNNNDIIFTNVAQNS